MSCTVHQSLEDHWKWLVHNGEQCQGKDSPAVILYWQMFEHRQKCQVCRDEDIARNIFIRVKTS